MNDRRVVVVSLSPLSPLGSPQTVTWRRAHAKNKAADSCAETCIGNKLSNMDTVNACMQRCERSLPLINQTVQQELNNLQVRITAPFSRAGAAVVKTQASRI